MIKICAADNIAGIDATCVEHAKMAFATIRWGVIVEYLARQQEATPRGGDLNVDGWENLNLSPEAGHLSARMWMCSKRCFHQHEPAVAISER